MQRFARIFSVLAVLALSLTPLAPVAAQCVDQAAMSEVTAMADMPCCPSDDEPAGPTACKTGCVQVVAVTAVTAGPSKAPLPVYASQGTVSHADWLSPPATDPPRSILRS